LFASSKLRRVDPVRVLFVGSLALWMLHGCADFPPPATCPSLETTAEGRCIRPDGGEGGGSGAGGSNGAEGGGGAAGHGMVTFPCSEEGVRSAIAAGGGPNVLECNVPTVVRTEAEIVIDQSMILDGLGRLTIDAGRQHRVFSVEPDLEVELRGMTIRGGSANTGAGVDVRDATVKLVDCAVVENVAENAPAIFATANASLTILRSTVVDNQATGIFAGGVAAAGDLLIENSTLSRNTPNSLFTFATTTARLTHVTIVAPDSRIDEPVISLQSGSVVLAGSIVRGRCDDPDLFSDGTNIESPGNTCGLPAALDHLSVSAEELALGPLVGDAGNQRTHEPGTGSVAIDALGSSRCELNEDQRRVPRPQGEGCDVGSVEVDP